MDVIIVLVSSFYLCCLLHLVCICQACENNHVGLAAVERASLLFFFLYGDAALVRRELPKRGMLGRWSGIAERGWSCHGPMLIRARLSDLY